MIFLTVIAHANEAHTDTSESVTHILKSWYVSFPLFLLILFVIGVSTWLLSHKKIDTVLFVLAAVLLLIGFLSYTFSSLISVFSITVGIVLAGFLAFTGLLQTDNDESADK